MKLNRLLILALVPVLASSCNRAESFDALSDRVFDLAKTQYTLMDSRLADNQMPRSFADGQVIDSDIQWWCSGFYPGSLWYIYEYTGDESIKALAEKNTHKLDSICDWKTDHDIGFQVWCSFGNALRLTGDESYKGTIGNAAAKLAGRFNTTVGCIKSWDNPRYIYPVIIDNMMNLELLEESSKLFSCDSLDKIARAHANTTMQNHYRPDNSCFHLVDYIPETGAVDHKQTVQGYADETAWSRGNAWGLYGYTMMYRETGDETYLAQAEKIAAFFIPMLPEDGVPEWDFNAPGTAHACAADAPGHPEAFVWNEGDPVLRDASAGAIAASALAELSTLTKDGKAAELYRSTSEKTVRTLASEAYLASTGQNGNFLLKHSVGNLHGNGEVDVPLTYADYYFLEAIIRLRK